MIPLSERYSHIFWNSGCFLPHSETKWNFEYCFISVRNQPQHISDQRLFESDVQQFSLFLTAHSQEWRRCQFESDMNVSAIENIHINFQCMWYSYINQTGKSSFSGIHFFSHFHASKNDECLFQQIEHWYWRTSFIFLKLFWNNIEHIFDSSSPLLCLHIDEQSGGWIKVKMLNPTMKTGFTEDCEFNSLFLEEVEWPFSIADFLESSFFLDCFPDFRIWGFFSVVDIIIRPCSIWIASSGDQVFCCFSHRWKSYKNIFSNCLHFSWFLLCVLQWI